MILRAIAASLMVGGSESRHRNDLIDGSIMSSGIKLGLAALVVIGTTAYIAYLGAAESWQYYVTSDECLADPGHFANKQLRVSGKVAEGTLRHTRGSRHASFAMQGIAHTLPVVCVCEVPDNLSEGIEVVVEGKLDADGTLQGNKLLTKCASKYSSDDAKPSGADRD